eukprot:gene5305-6607_t
MEFLAPISMGIKLTTIDHLYDLLINHPIHSNKKFKKDHLIWMFTYFYKYHCLTDTSKLFKVSTKTLNTWINEVSNSLADIIKNNELAVDTSKTITYNSETFSAYAIDCTSIQILTPGTYLEQKKVYSGKNKQHEMKFETIVDFNGKMVFASGPHQGSIHNKKISDESSGDKGYSGSPKIACPIKRRKGIDFTDEEWSYNHFINTNRVIVENFYLKLKRFKIMSSTNVETILKVVDQPFYKNLFADTTGFCDGVKIYFVLNGFSTATNVKSLDPKITFKLLSSLTINSTFSQVIVSATIPIGAHSLSIQINDTSNVSMDFPNFHSYDCKRIESTNIIPNFHKSMGPNRNDVLSKKIIFSVPLNDQSKGMQLPKDSIGVYCRNELYQCEIVQPSYYNRGYYSIDIKYFSEIPIGIGFLSTPSTIEMSDLINDINSSYNTASFVQPPPTQSFNSTFVDIKFYPSQNIQFETFERMSSHALVTFKNKSKELVYMTNNFVKYVNPFGEYEPLSGNPDLGIYKISLGNIATRITLTHTLTSYLNSTGGQGIFSKQIVYNVGTTPSFPISTIVSGYSSKDGDIIDIGFTTSRKDTEVRLFSKIELTPFVLDTSYNIEYPFGFSNGNAKSYRVSLSFMASKHSVFPQYLLKVVTNAVIDSNYNIADPDYSTDLTPPVLKNIEYFKINETHFLTRVYATDETSGIFAIYLGGYSSPTRVVIDSSYLVAGDIFDGIYERVMTVQLQKGNMFYTPMIQLVNYAGSQVTFDDFKSTSTLELMPIDPKTLYLMENPFSVINITNFQFSRQLFDENGSINETLRLNLTNASPNWFPVFRINYPQGAPSRNFTATWDTATKQYQFLFDVESNLFSGLVDYELEFYYAIVVSFEEVAAYLGDDVANLEVRSTVSDQMPPIITEITPITQTSILEGEVTIYSMGWELKIEDGLNGFEWGQIKVLSDWDLAHNIFTLKPNPKGHLVTGDKFVGTYRIIINQTLPCRSQFLSIDEIILKDSKYYTSRHSAIKLAYSTLMNPLITMSNQIIPPIELTCLSNSDNNSPTITAMSISPMVVDVGLQDDSLRNVTVEFQVTDLISKISVFERHYPIVYFTYGRSSSMSAKSYPKTISPDGKTVTFAAHKVIPYGLTPFKPITISVYGLIDELLNFNGYSSLSLNESNLASNIMTVFNPSLIITSTSKVTTNGGVLTIYGSFFSVTKTSSTLQLNDQGTFKNISTDFISGQYITTNISPITNNFKIKLYSQFYNNILESNEYTVSVEIIPTPSPSSPTPSPTPSPTSTTKCRGTPLCGGEKQGRCDDSVGCICIEPWYGFECQSQIINTTEPTVDDNTPETNTNGTGTLPNGDTINFTSLISMVSLRELGYDYKVLRTHPFSIWVLTNLSNQTTTLYHYSTNVTNRVNDQDFNTSVNILISQLSSITTMIMESIKHVPKDQDYQNQN